MNRASASEIADRLLHDLTPVDPAAADTLGMEPENVMPALAPADGTSHTWREVTTVHHEGVPGHHLQITVAMTESGLHPWQRSMAHVHGYVEGWAHYAERLADAAERRPGFDLRAFQMRALRLGPLGLGPLREGMS